MTTSRTLLAAGLLVVGSLGSAAWAHEQSVGMRPVTPVVLSGPDIGFRMTGRRGDTPVGDLVVRINGVWEKVEFAHGLKLATK